jgi:hypothetical protein
MSRLGAWSLGDRRRRASRVHNFHLGHPDQGHRNDLDGRHVTCHLAIDIGRAFAGDLASGWPGDGRLGCRR